MTKYTKYLPTSITSNLSPRYGHVILVTLAYMAGGGGGGGVDGRTVTKTKFSRIDGISIFS